MEWLSPAIMATLAGSLFLVVIYAYLYFEDREPYMVIWTAGWIFSSLRYILQLISGWYRPIPILSVADQLATWASGVFLLWGILAFLKKPLHRLFWPGVTIVAIWIVLAEFNSIPFELHTIPTFFLLGGIYIWLGIQLLRSPYITGPGKPMAGWSFIIWGLHKLDYPWLRNLDWFAPWGFLLASLLSFTVAVGFIVVYNHRIRAQLRQSEARFRSLFEKAPLAYQSLNRSAHLLAVNETWLEMLGYTRQEVIGKWMGDFLAPEYRGDFDKNFSDLLTIGKASGREFELLQADGSRLSVAIDSKVSYDTEGNPAQTHCILRDITPRRNALRALENKSNQLERLVDTARYLTESLDLQEVLERIGGSAKDLAVASGCTLYMLEPDGKSLNPVVALEDYSDEILSTPLDVDTSLTGKGIKARRGLIFNKAFDEPGGTYIPGTPQDYDERIITTPFIVDQRVLGAMTLNRIGMDFTSEDLALAETFAAYAATAIKNAQAHAALQHEIQERELREREMSTVVTVAGELRGVQIRSEIIPIVVEQIQIHLGAERAALCTRDPLTGESLFECVLGNSTYKSGTRLPPGEGITGHVIATGKPYLTNSGRSDDHLSIESRSRASNSLAAVPLIAREETIGAIIFGREGEINEADVRLLTAIAEIAASAIRRATHFEETERQVHRLRALHTIDIAITTNFDPEATLQVLLDQITAQLKVDAAAILLSKNGNGLLNFAAGRGFDTEAIRSTQFEVEALSNIPCLESITGHPGPMSSISTNGHRLYYLPDLRQDSLPSDRIYKLAQREGFHAYVGMPLLAHGQMKGFLELYQRSPLNEDQEWWEFLDNLSHQAAIAIDNAELFSDLQGTNHELIEAYEATLAGWAKALELRDKETQGHSNRVTELALELACAMGLDEDDLDDVRRGTMLHDIGKMGIPDNILQKPGPLTPEEWDIMRQHPRLAHDLLSPIRFLGKALDIPFCHHEKWDGSGYPRGLKGEEIPLSARIFALVDVYDALLSDRPYRPAWTEGEVHKYFGEQAGAHFDPQLVPIFLEILREKDSGKELSQ